MPHNLKRRRAGERANATRFYTTLEGFEDSPALDDLEHYRRRIKETLDRLISLDDAIHDFLPDKKYEEDINTCEEYIDKTKRAIQKASRRIDNSLSVSTARLSFNGPTQQTALAPTGSVARSVKLPAIKMEFSKAMWKLGLDFGRSFCRPSTKTPPFQLLTSKCFCVGIWMGNPRYWWTE